MVSAQSVFKNINQRAKKMDELNIRDITNRIIGDLLAIEKYRFVDSSLVADVVRETVYRITENDCPDCGTPLNNGRCPNPAKHNGGVE
jgi:hypothetical protein